jgi:hypothetical protein
MRRAQSACPRITARGSGAYSSVRAFGSTHAAEYHLLLFSGDQNGQRSASSVIEYIEQGRWVGVALSLFRLLPVQDEAS